MITSKSETTKRRINALETKSKLFHSAIRLFALHSYEKVTIDDITRDSGTAKGSFYTHFKSKEHIMLEQFKQIDLNYEKWFKNFDPDASATDQLVSFVICVTNYSANDLGLDILKVVFSSQISLASRMPQLLAEEERPYFNIMSTICRCGQERQEFRNDLSDIELARLMTRWIRGLVYDWCLLDGNFDLVQEAQAKLPYIFSGIKSNC